MRCAMNYLQVFLIALNSMTSLAFSSQSETWQRISSGIYESDVQALAVHPNNPSLIYAATDKALYQSSDKGLHYESIFRASGESQTINRLYIDPYEPKNIYAATAAGAYESRDAGHNWQRIYFSSDEQSRNCLALLRVDDILYLGTAKGLFTKPVHETSWSALRNELGNKPVYHIARGERFIYFATADSIYDLDRRTNGYSRIFTAGSAQMVADEEELSSEEEISRQLIRFIEVTDDEDAAIYIATTRGIYLSGNEGRHWRLLANPPVSLETLSAFVILGGEEDRKLLVGTKRGAFLFDDGRWTPLYEGLQTNRMNDLVKDARGTVYAATDRGVFYLSAGQAFPFPSEQRLDEYSRHEPSIQQVHRWAIDYAEVDPQKIKSWRSLARTRAFMPDLSVGLDRGDGELFHWDTGPNPDNLIKGRDLLSWDVSLSWNLGDLVWSTDQTTIDSRSKMMVELREDVLDQVTRLYFERRRIQLELADEAFESASRLDRQLRIEELTALLDAFTGGRFSQSLKMQDAQRQEVRRSKETEMGS